MCRISPSSILFHKSILDQTGYFDESFTVCEDYDLWLRITSRYPVLFIDEPLVVKHGGHNDQLSKKYWGIDRYRIISLEKIIESGCLCSEQRKIAINSLLEKINIFLKGCDKYGDNKYCERFKKIKCQYA